MNRTRRNLGAVDLASQLPATMPQRRAGRLAMCACQPLPISGTRVDVELLVKTMREQENMYNSSHHMVLVCTYLLRWRNGRSSGMAWVGVGAPVHQELL